MPTEEGRKVALNEGNTRRRLSRHQRTSIALTSRRQPRNQTRTAFRPRTRVRPRRRRIGQGVHQGRVVHEGSVDGSLEQCGMGRLSKQYVAEAMGWEIEGLVWNESA